MPASGPRSHCARVHPRPYQGCQPWLRASAASGLVLATRNLGCITGRGTRLRPLTDRSTGHEDKRRLILDAAVRVFARKGYHTSRVGDIAEEAGVAHGLLYHYFRSKEELLETIFRETWRDVLDADRAVEETDESARDRLAGIAKILLRAWRR